MTPAQQFAAKRSEAETLIRGHAPAPLQEPLISLLRPAIALSATRTDDAQIPVGASKFGGAPDVPEGFEWPMWNDKPLGFLAQINLEEVAPFDVEEVLPKSGLLSFFYDFEEMPWGGTESDAGSWRVLHHPNSSVRATWPEGLSQTNQDFLPSFQIAFQVEWTVPDSWELELDEEEDTAYAMVFLPQLAGGRNVFHRMFGYANNIQDPVIEIEVMRRLRVHFYNDHKEEIQAGAKDWTLLLQVDSDLQFPTMWGDGGMLYFIIRNEDLVEEQFQETKFALQCG